MCRYKNSLTAAGNDKPFNTQKITEADPKDAETPAYDPAFPGISLSYEILGKQEQNMGDNVFNSKDYQFAKTKNSYSSSL